MSNVATVTTMRSLVTHTLTRVKSPQTRSLPTPLITSLALWAFIARNLQTMLVVNDQEDGEQSMDMCKTFYDAVPDDPNYGGRQ